jgi:hypothetical protein
MEAIDTNEQPQEKQPEPVHPISRRTFVGLALGTMGSLLAA